uniref:Ycf13 n=1 Tax=Phacus inflexus TaxID=461210 RepID=A0A3G3LKR7_9EUGL|nr:ycf13 [Phacus inflexus]AYQ93297.1 ycf13 [Phacus inflexus]
MTSFICNTNIPYSWNMLSWDKARANLYRLQKRIFKSVFVGDIQKCLQIQKLLISSNSACLLSIRLVSQSNIKYNSGVDDKISLSFLEKFELVKFLQKNANNWSPQKNKKISFINENSCFYKKTTFTFSDQSWQTLVKFALEPAHEAIFSPRNFGYRSHNSIYDAQKILFLNLNKASYGFQKRVLIVKFSDVCYSFNYNILLKKIIIPRSIKLGIFRFLKSGLFPSFEKPSSENSLEILLANILLNGVENIHNSIRYGSNFLIFLNPSDNESIIINKLERFLDLLGIPNLNKVLKIYSAIDGFDFLNWHFKVYNNFNLYCSPSTENYRTFLKRVKLIINNSNYGSSVKVLKISPIIKEWKIYNQFCNLKNFKTSLFFLQKKAFKSFSKESKNDRYSTKRLISKSFFNLSSLDLNNINLNKKYSFYGVHILFWFEYKNFLPYNKICINNKILCIHCGLNI